MNTKLLMIVSAIILGMAGVVLSFFPQEVSNYLGFGGKDSIILQLIGSLYFGFAMINWTAKANLIGGIYSRPVAIGNFTHFMISALALTKLSFNGVSPSYIWIAAIVYSIFAILFGFIFFTNPVMKNKSI
jgi:uncharacterized membrane protein YtjA (UPF0391 family)